MAETSLVRPGMSYITSFDTGYTLLDKVPEQTVRNAIVFGSASLKDGRYRCDMYAINVYAIRLNDKAWANNTITCRPGDRITLEVYWRVMKGECERKLEDTHSFFETTTGDTHDSKPPGCKGTFDFSPVELRDPSSGWGLPFIVDGCGGATQPDGQPFYPCIDSRHVIKMSRAGGLGAWDQTRVCSRSESEALIPDLVRSVSGTPVKLSELVCVSQMHFGISESAESSMHRFKLTHEFSKGSADPSHHLVLKTAKKHDYADITIEVVRPMAKL